MAASICSDLGMPHRNQSNRRKWCKSEVGRAQLDRLELLLRHAQILSWEYLLFDWHYCIPYSILFRPCPGRTQLTHFVIFFSPGSKRIVSSGTYFAAPICCVLVQSKRSCSGKTGNWSGGFLQNPRAQKVNLNIFYLISKFVAKWRIRQKYQENLGFDREVSCKILGLKKLTWISSIWCDKFMQNGASDKIPGTSGIWSGGFLQNPRAQKVNLDIFYLISKFVAKWRIRQKYQENLGFDREVSCKILGLKKLTWISSIWSDNLLQNGASDKNTRKSSLEGCSIVWLPQQKARGWGIAEGI